MRAKYFLMTAVILLVISCSAQPTPTPILPTSTPMPSPDAKATEVKIAANILATQTASVPTATNTPIPTNTLISTDTPAIPTISPDEAIRPLDWTWYLRGTGNYIYVDGEIQNTSSELMRFVEISIKLTDTNKTLLATDRGFVNVQVLGPGEKSTFKLMTPYQPSTKYIAITNIQWQWAGKGTQRSFSWNFSI